MQTRKHIADEVGPVEFLMEMYAYLGAKRGSQIVGRAILWGLLGLENKAQIIEFEQGKDGVSRASAYRLVDDFAAFLRYLEDKHAWQGTLAQGVAEIRAAAMSQP